MPSYSKVMSEFKVSINKTQNLCNKLMDNKFRSYDQCQLINVSTNTGQCLTSLITAMKKKFVAESKAEIICDQLDNIKVKLLELNKLCHKYQAQNCLHFDQYVTGFESILSSTRTFITKLKKKKIKNDKLKEAELLTSIEENVIDAALIITQMNAIISCNFTSLSLYTEVADLRNYFPKLVQKSTQILTDIIEIKKLMN